MVYIQRLFSGPYEENAYLVYVDERDDALIIDPGGRPEPLLEAAQKLGRHLSDILITHGHFDHVLGAPRLRALSGSSLHIHPLDAPMLWSTEPFKLPPNLDPRFEPSQPDALLSAPLLSVCGMDFAVLHTPGHTPGGVCFYLPDDMVLFTGDTLFRDGFGRTDLAGGSAKQLRESLRTLFQLPKEIRIYPGHGEPDTLSHAMGSLL